MRSCIFSSQGDIFRSPCCSDYKQKVVLLTSAKIYLKSEWEMAKLYIFVRISRTVPLKYSVYVSSHPRDNALFRSQLDCVFDSSYLNLLRGPGVVFDLAKVEIEFSVVSDRGKGPI